MTNTMTTGKITVLWAVRKGAPAWQEEILTTRPEWISDAQAWAQQNGFEKFRVAVIEPEMPDFAACIEQGRLNVRERRL